MSSQKEPELWKLDTVFKHAPPRPDGDPWSILLKPLLDKDKKRCDAWKDEVQNLLIFVSNFHWTVPRASQS